jgi:sec-independent protein translocase protein TatA
MGGLTPGHLIIVLIVALVVIGPGKLPELGSALGKSLREFQKAVGPMKDMVDPAKMLGLGATPEAGQPAAMQQPMQQMPMAMPMQQMPMQMPVGQEMPQQLPPMYAQQAQAYYPAPQPAMAVPQQVPPQSYPQMPVPAVAEPTVSPADSTTADQTGIAG